MIAFHGENEIKKTYLKRVDDHRKADELVKGRTGQEGKGCAVWCTLNNYNHAAYETELGIPEWLARVEDCFFENLPNDESQKWPAQFLKAINPGADLEKIKAPFMIYILNQSLGNFDHDKFPEVKKSIETVIGLWEKYPNGSSSAWSEAESAARSAARSAAESAARSAAESAAWSAAWSEAESAARSAAESAAYIKYSKHLLTLLKACK